MINYWIVVEYIKWVNDASYIMILVLIYSTLFEHVPLIQSWLFD